METNYWYALCIGVKKRNAAKIRISPRNFRKPLLLQNR